ncbi:MAG: hypothetical protein H7X80_08950 [bacterium]|nr:hypothetical protein [Candidatus Kapabacteria bacterium]
MTTFRTLITRILFVVAALLACSGESSAQYRFRLAHLITGIPALDLYIQGSTTPYLEDVPYEFLSARSASFSVTSELIITRANAGVGTPLFSPALPSANGTYSLLAYGTSAAPKLATLIWPYSVVAGPGTSALRVFNASTAGRLDVYFDSTSGSPELTSISQDSASAFQIRPAASTSLIITAAGSKVPIARFVLPLIERTSQTLVISGSGASDLVVRSFSDGSALQDQTAMTTLQREQVVGAAPTLRFVNALPQPDARRLDVYLNRARTAEGVNYRSASGVLTGVGVGAIEIDLVPEDRTILDSVYGKTMMLARDTAYALVLTQFSGGSIVSMDLKRSFSEPLPAAGKTKIRLANATDFYRGMFYVFNNGADTVRFANPAFLTVSDWQEIPAGLLTLDVFQQGNTTPLVKGSYNAPSGGFLTLIAIGGEPVDTKINLTVDVLVHDDPGPQQPMASFNEQEASVREHIAAAARSMRLISTPNPIVNDARISFELAHAGDVTLALYDVMGRRVMTLLSGWQQSGAHSVAVDGLTSGAYTAVLRSGSVSAAIGVIKY